MGKRTPTMNWKRVVLKGAPATEICALAKNFDLIVIATHGRTGLKYFWIGSIAEKVVRRSPCPLLAVRHSADRTDVGNGNPFPAERMLVPSDFSTLSKGAVARGAQLAKRFRAKIDLLHVFESPPYPEFAYAHVALKESGHRRLVAGKIDALSRDVPGLQDVLGETLVRTGSIAHEILQTALLLNSDLIVMATHARTGPQHLALGSNTEKVLRHAHCPVLIFPPRK